MKSVSWRGIFIPMSHAALFTALKIQKQPTCLSTDEQRISGTYMYTQGILFSLKKEGNPVLIEEPERHYIK